MTAETLATLPTAAAAPPGPFREFWGYFRANHGADIEKAIGGDFKGVISIVIYALGMLVALKVPVLSYFIYAIVSVIWFIPDRRLVRR